MQPGVWEKESFSEHRERGYWILSGKILKSSMILRWVERDTFASLKSEKVYKNLSAILIMAQQPASAVQPAQSHQPASAAQPVQGAQPSPATQGGQPEKKKSKWLLCTLVILAAIGAVVCIVFFSFKSFG